MDGKGAKAKGSAWERAVGAELSLWLTGGARKDLFSRTVLSGGRFTRQAGQGDASGLPGDLMAAHPLAFDFLAQLSIECKHRHSIELAQYLLDLHSRSFLARTVASTRQQAAQAGLRWLVVAKGNRQPAIVLMDQPTGEIALGTVRRPGGLLMHRLHGDSVAMLPFAQFLASVRPHPFVRRLRTLSEAGASQGIDQ